MMTLLHMLSYAGGIAGFLFVTLSLASGLLWLAELIEEHSRTAKVVGVRAIYVIIGLHVLLLVVDRLPPLLILFSILCHLVYLQNFTASWPFISLTSARFLMSCCLVVADHFLWFFFFAEKAQSAKRYNRQPKYRYGQKKDQLEVAPTFMDVAAFFAICVWLVPLFLFLSLSANDNALPSFGGDPSMAGTPSGEIRNPIDLADTPGVPQYNSYSHKAAARNSLVKSILAPVLSLLPRLRRKARLEDGLIAPRTPIRGTPIHSPSISVSQLPYVPWSGSDDANSNAVTPAFIERVTNSHTSAGRRATQHLTPPPPPRRAMSEILGSGSPPRRAVSGPSIRNSTELMEHLGNPNGVASAIARTGTPPGFMNGGSAIRRVPSTNAEGENGKRKAD